MSNLEAVMEVLGSRLRDNNALIEYYKHKAEQAEAEAEQLRAKVAELDALLNPPNSAEKWPKTVAEGLFDVMSKDWDREKGLTNATEGGAAYD